MRRIDQISDLHFGRTDDVVVASLVDRLNEDPADLIAVTGDLTMRARRREYAAAMEFLRALKAPWIAIPGNHDITAYWPWERFLDPYGRFRHFVSPEIEPGWIDDEVAVLSLNTVSRGGLRRNWSDGSVHRAGLIRLLRKLRTVPPDRTRIVLAHHPFLAPPTLPTATLARHSGRALRLLARANVTAILTGHLHRTYTSPYTILNSSKFLPLVVSCGSSTSTRLREENNSYNRLYVEQRSIFLENCRWSGRCWITERGF
ncbi:metallophosphoesterase family protein [Roseomonas elaeocarpi]|uniref:Metallophosphoesterase family protein n=1 Tax=Roseomonas elaeocarpi TaxID=907779 RepID=A0ABV6JUK8_9PROT